MCPAIRPAHGLCDLADGPAGLDDQMSQLCVLIGDVRIERAKVCGVLDDDVGVDDELWLVGGRGDAGSQRGWLDALGSLPAALGCGLAERLGLRGQGEWLTGWGLSG